MSTVRSLKIAVTTNIQSQSANSKKTITIIAVVVSIAGFLILLLVIVIILLVFKNYKKKPNQTKLYKPDFEKLLFLAEKRAKPTPATQRLFLVSAN